MVASEVTRCSVMMFAGNDVRIYATSDVRSVKWRFSPKDEP